MRRRIVGLGLGVALVVAALLVLGTSASALPAAPRVIDRTFGCTPEALEGTLRATDVNAVPVRAIEPYNPFQHPSPGFIGAASGGWEPGSDLVSIRARGWQRFRSTYSPEGVYASVRRCRLSRISVPLSASGLPGPPVQFARQTTCLGRGRVLIRVRATLSSRASWQPQTDSFDGARSNVVQAAIAVRSERTGKPLAYMELGRDGKTKLWHSPRCR
jgi:hypothetical protein